MKDLKKKGVLGSAKDQKALEVFFMKKDEAVLQAFDQYADAPDEVMFMKRVEGFLLPERLQQKEAPPEKAKPKKEKAAPKPAAESKPAEDAKQGGGEGHVGYVVVAEVKKV